MSRRRNLTEDEEALWRGFTRSIKPLRTRRKTLAPSATPPSTVSPEPPARFVQKSEPSRHGPNAGISKNRLLPPPLAPLGRRLKQRVARGREPIDVRLDLHGLTQTDAHAALLRFLQQAQADGARMALVITGKGRSRSNTRGEAGILRRQVPMWLALPEFRAFIVGFEDAHVGHGGDGALYVRVRRRADTSC